MRFMDAYLLSATVGCGLMVNLGFVNRLSVGADSSVKCLR